MIDPIRPHRPESREEYEEMKAEYDGLVNQTREAFNVPDVIPKGEFPSYQDFAENPSLWVARGTPTAMSDFEVAYWYRRALIHGVRVATALVHAEDIADGLMGADP